MIDREALQKRLLETFREEAAEHVLALEGELGFLIDAENPAAERERIETLFRVIHTLKGAARSVRFSGIEVICQANETLLHRITRGGIVLTAQHLDSLKLAVAEIARQLHLSDEVSAPPVATAGKSTEPALAPAPLASSTKEAALPAEGGAGITDVPVSSNLPRLKSVDQTIAAPAESRSEFSMPGQSLPEPTQVTLTSVRGTEVKPRAATELPAIRNGESVRVGIGQLDRLLRAAEELLIPSMVAGERARVARELTGGVAALRRQLRHGANGKGRDVEGFGENHAYLLDALRDIENGSRRLALALQEDYRGLTAAVSELFKETRQARMLPAAIIFTAFPAMVRDLCQETAKLAKWRLRDNGIEVDRKVIEIVKDPLIHIVRNAIDHGIEAPEQRELAGKPRRGRITATIQAMEGGRVAIEISDDGRGMNLSALRNAALRARAASQAQLQALSDHDVIDLAFRSGISTSPVITSISGLGLGLSIVREQIERMDGRVIVRSGEGKGTTIRLELPANVASYQGLLVMAGDTRLLWPSDAVERVIGLSRDEVEAAMRTGVHVHGGEALPFAHVSALLDLPLDEALGQRRGLYSCVIVAGSGRRAVIMVDAVSGKTDILMKDLPAPLKRVRHIASAGLLPTGEMALVLRPADILASIQGMKHRSKLAARMEAKRTKRILVVDDSMTTRTMERNLFEAVGYVVEVAADGSEGWDMVRSGRFDLVVSDIDMPRLNGFDLTARIRADAKLADIPVVLVTALESREDRDRGIQIGANAYVLKSSFDQSNLLEIVGRLV